MILLPDDWTFPTNLSEKSTPATGFKSFRSDWSSTYTAEDWAKMEANGAVFLPAAGTRGEDWVEGADNVNWQGYYWSSTPRLDMEADFWAFCMKFDLEEVDPFGYFDKNFGCAVRLVRPL